MIRTFVENHQALVGFLILTSPLWLVGIVGHFYRGGWKQAAYRKGLKQRMRAIEYGYDTELFNQQAVRELQRRGRL